jgi:hypothetical protein
VHCTEKFACAVRRDHPEVGERLSLALYTKIPHVVVTLGDDERPTWIDEALAKKGGTRRIAVRTRYFMAAPLIVAKSDLLLTAPSMLVRYFADADPAHRWLRELMVRVTSELGTGTPPTRRRFERASARQERHRRAR